MGREENIKICRARAAVSSSIVYCSGLKYTLNCRMRMRITYILYERTPCYAAIAIVHAPTRRHRYRMKLENNQSRGNERKMEQGQGAERAMGDVQGTLPARRRTPAAQTGRMALHCVEDPILESRQAEDYTLCTDPRDNRPIAAVR